MRHAVVAALRTAAVAATCVALMSGAPAAGLAQGTSQPPTGAISGTIVDGATNAPLADAIVYLNAPGAGPAGSQPRQLTDARGRFAFTNLRPSDTYTIAAWRTGYLTNGFGPPEAAAARNRVLKLVDGEWLSDVRIALWPPGLIAGSVRDEVGDPVVGVMVRLVSRIQVAGRGHLASGPVTVTDDLGQYRVAGLAPGTYLVAVPSMQTAVPASLPVRPPGPAAELDRLIAIGPRVSLAISTGPIPPPFDGRLLVYPTTFHGGRTVGEAIAIELGSGDRRESVDVRLSPVPTSTVTGRLIGPDEAMATIVVRLLPDGLEDLADGEAAITRPESDGTFMFVGVPAGSYVVDAPMSINEYAYADVAPGTFASSRPAQPLLSGSGSHSESVDVGPSGTSFVSRQYNAGVAYGGRSTITVSEDMAPEVSVTLRPGGSIAGRVIIDGGRPDAAPPAYMTVSADAADGSPALGRPSNRARTIAPDWEFQLEGFGAGRYVMRATAPAPWIIKSVVAAGRDYTDTSIDTAVTPALTGVIVTLTDEGAVLSGTARDDRAGVVPAAVLVFPADRTQWTNYGISPRRIKTTVAGADGRYRFPPLPAGDYFVLAIDLPEIRAWQDPAFLERAAARATRVTLAWGSSRTQDVRLAGR